MTIKRDSQTEEKQTEMKEKSANAPVIKMRAGKFDIAVFEHEGKLQGQVNRSIQLRKSWTKDDGKTWDESSITIFERELADLVILLHGLQSKLRVKTS